MLVEGGFDLGGGGFSLRGQVYDLDINPNPAANGSATASLFDPSGVLPSIAADVSQLGDGLCVQPVGFAQFCLNPSPLGGGILASDADGDFGGNWGLVLNLNGS